MAKGGRGRGTRHGGSTREEDDRGGGCRIRDNNQRLAARHRRQWVSFGASEWILRPERGSATGAPEGGVGARGGISGGVVPKDTATTGVKAASAAGQYGTRPRRSSLVPTIAATRVTNLPVGAGRSSILIRGPCVRKSRISVEVRGSLPETAFSGRGTSPPKPLPGANVEGVSRPQALTRHMESSSTGVRGLESLRSCSVAPAVAAVRGNLQNHLRCPFGTRVCSQYHNLR